VPGPNAPKGDLPRNLKPVIAELDKQIGRLMDGIRELGIEKDTLVIFVTDNGPLPTFKGARSAGMRGAKLSLYEAGVRLPFIVRWPGQVPAGRVDNTTVISGLDFFPTLCAIGGAKIPDNAKPDGHDVTGALRGQAVANRDGAIFWEYGRNNEFFKFPGIATDRSPNVAVRDGKWKLLINADGSGAELYDVTTDRSESINVATQHPEVTKKLSEQALAWRRSLP
jgi:arylsulfatase A-like enzyme